MCFPVNITKLLRTPILKNICERLLSIQGDCGKVCTYNDVIKCDGDFFYFTENEGSLILSLNLLSDY